MAWIAPEYSCADAGRDQHDSRAGPAGHAATFTPAPDPPTATAADAGRSRPCGLLLARGRIPRMPTALKSMITGLVSGIEPTDDLRREHRRNALS
jgi:hypothetical protein